MPTMTELALTYVYEKNLCACMHAYAHVCVCVCCLHVCIESITIYYVLALSCSTDSPQITSCTIYEGEVTVMMAGVR